MVIPTVTFICSVASALLALFIVLIEIPESERKTKRAKALAWIGVGLFLVALGSGWFGWIDAVNRKGEEIAEGKRVTERHKELLKHQENTKKEVEKAREETREEFATLMSTQMANFAVLDAKYPYGFVVFGTAGEGSYTPFKSEFVNGLRLEVEADWGRFVLKRPNPSAPVALLEFNLDSLKSISVNGNVNSMANMESVMYINMEDGFTAPFSAGVFNNGVHPFVEILDADAEEPIWVIGFKQIHLPENKPNAEPAVK